MKSAWRLCSVERIRSYLEQLEFELHYDTLALCWLLRNVKDVGRLGRWILLLLRFKFKVQHTKNVHIVVADSLSRKLEGQEAGVRGETIWPSCKICHSCTSF